MKEILTWISRLERHSQKEHITCYIYTKLCNPPGSYKTTTTASELYSLYCYILMIYFGPQSHLPVLVVRPPAGMQPVQQPSSAPHPETSEDQPACSAPGAISISPIYRDEKQKTLLAIELSHQFCLNNLIDNTYGVAYDKVENYVST